MSKSQRESLLSELTSKIFSQMLNEVVMDSAIQSHQEIVRSRAICEVCHRRCGHAHVPSIPTMPATQVLQSSQASSPSPNVADLNNATNGKSDGNIYLECIGCSRQIASNRYAPHLSSCLGFGIGVRRAVARISTQASKAKIAAQSQSPLRDIVEDNAPEEPKLAKLKGRPKGSTNKRTEIETDVMTSQSSVSGLPTAISKKQKLTVPPQVSKKSDTDLLQQTPGTVSTATSAPGTAAKSRASSTESGSSSDNPMASASTSTSSNVSLQSPSLPTSTSISRRKKDSKSVTASTPKRLPSAIPSKPSPTPVPVTTVRRIPDIDYHIDVEGEETGSSSDTDS